jgi:hypothetical protein
MSVTNEQAATLRAYLAGNFDEHDRLHAKLDPIAARTGYSALISAAFVLATEKRFAENETTADVAKFVSDLRARSEGLAEDIDPRTAERLILAVYTDEEIDDLDSKTRLGTQFLLLAALVIDEKFSDAELDVFIADARALADEWIG